MRTKLNYNHLEPDYEYIEFTNNITKDICSADSEYRRVCVSMYIGISINNMIVYEIPYCM